MQSVVGVAMVPEAILEKLEPMIKVQLKKFLSNFMYIHINIRTLIANI